MPVNAPSPWMLKALSVLPVKVHSALVPEGKVAVQSPVGLVTLVSAGQGIVTLVREFAPSLVAVTAAPTKFSVGWVVSAAPPSSVIAWPGDPPPGVKHPCTFPLASTPSGACPAEQFVGSAASAVAVLALPMKPPVAVRLPGVVMFVPSLTR